MFQCLFWKISDFNAYFGFKQEIDHLGKRTLFRFDLLIAVRLRSQPSSSDNFRFKPEMSHQIVNRTQFPEFVTKNIGPEIFKRLDLG